MPLLPASPSHASLSFHSPFHIFSRHTIAPSLSLLQSTSHFLPPMSLFSFSPGSNSIHLLISLPLSNSPTLFPILLLCLFVLCAIHMCVCVCVCASESVCQCVHACVRGRAWALGICGYFSGTGPEDWTVIIYGPEL